MKITELNINSYKHLENLKFDFRYPKNYKDKSKAGKPLDKICFIGQSATGKTKLLELIYEHLTDALNQEIVNGHIPYNSNMRNLDGKINFSFNDKMYIKTNKKIEYSGMVYEYKNVGGSVTELIPKSEKSQVLLFNANLISEQNLDIFTKNPIDTLEAYKSRISDIERNLKFKEDYGLRFDQNVDSKLWLFLLLDILDYRKKHYQKITDILYKKTANKEKILLEISKWEKENPNALDGLAEKLNPILERLSLEVDISNTEYIIPILNKKNEEIIPIQDTSTGTKGLLLSFLPLFKLNTTDAIILMDEPERSLYPDMQMDLIEHYQNIAPEAQFIVATHSPFIAASFEPEERFILYFDDKGNVKVRQGKSPIGDDPNDLLKNDFGVNYYNKYGEDAYKTYVDLKQKVANEKDAKKKKELMLKMVKLGDQYNF